MAYLPRYEIIYDDAFFHVTWQCHNEDWLLQWDWAKRAYYDLLLKYKDRYGIEIHAYNFMDNHPHLAGHLRSKEEFSDFFRLVNSLFARIVNKQLKRRGQVVMDRFKSPIIESEEHMLNAMAYIDLNPHRVKKVKHPRENRWSSYHFYAYGQRDPLITPSPLYLNLAKTAVERQYEYRMIVASLIEHRKLLNISHTHFIGNPEWVLKKYQELCDRLGGKMSKTIIRHITEPPE
jgi:REP-associated tyrosine transposase